MGFKQGVVGRTHGEHIGNLLGTKENEKNPLLLPPPLPPPPQNLKEKNMAL
jgi:hypothetical protein